MSARRLLQSSTRFRPPPTFIRDFLNLGQTTSTQSPYIPKGPSVLATNLIKSYFEKGLIREARILFDEMPERDVVAWTAMIAGYTSCNEHTRAWNMFCDMVKSDTGPNAFTISSVLKACKGLKSVACGVLVHGFAIKSGIEGSICVDNALLGMYATCCFSMKDACLVFQDIQEKNEVSWTSLIAGYTHRGLGYQGLQSFRQMLLEEEVKMNPFSFSIAVRACASIESQNYGKQIHTAVLKHGFESNLPVMNSLIDMYCRCGCFSDASRCFDEMTEKNLITWNTLIAGYESSDSAESLLMFLQMGSEGFSPNCFTFTSVIAACANLAALNYGQQVHGGIIRRGLDGDLVLVNALLDMYAKCGNINESCKIFGEMSCKNLVSWTSMMIAYGAHGYGKEAVELFDEMVSLGIRPDQIVFMAVLSACSHTGLIDQGLAYFNSMDDYNISPNQEIYGCVVDLLGRAGRVEEAYQLIQSMPFKPDESVWGALLAACKVHSLPYLGKLAAKRVLDLRPNMLGTYVMLSNIYAAEGKWGEFARVRKTMKGMGSKKEPGRSWIEVRSQVYSFVVGHKVGSRIEYVYEALELLVWHMKETGPFSGTDGVIQNVED